MKQKSVCTKQTQIKRTALWLPKGRRGGGGQGHIRGMVLIDTNDYT